MLREYDEFTPTKFLSGLPRFMCCTSTRGVFAGCGDPVKKQGKCEFLLLTDVAEKHTASDDPTEINPCIFMDMRSGLVVALHGVRQMDDC